MKYEIIKKFSSVKERDLHRSAVFLEFWRYLDKRNLFIDIDIWFRGEYLGEQDTKYYIKEGDEEAIAEFKKIVESSDLVEKYRKRIEAHDEAKEYYRFNLLARDVNDDRELTGNILIVLLTEIERYICLNYEFLLTVNNYWTNFEDDLMLTIGISCAKDDFDGDELFDIFAKCFNELREKGYAEQLAGLQKKELKRGSLEEVREVLSSIRFGLSD